ncbi:hypothetical protein GOBAR_DD02387 [Gossypium barbadense]|nr:hypothetical protein GOBAR_DD02387 [Gossypium barbadense]
MEMKQTYHEIIFKELKCLALYDLKNLKSFCSGNCTLKFPSLHDVAVIDYPAMENFCNGALWTPKLQEVETRWDVRRCWDLNAAIEQLNKEGTEWIFIVARAWHRGRVKVHYITPFCKMNLVRKVRSIRVNEG